MVNFYCILILLLFCLIFFCSSSWGWDGFPSSSYQTFWWYSWVWWLNLKDWQCGMVLRHFFHWTDHFLTFTNELQNLQHSLNNHHPLRLLVTHNEFGMTNQNNLQMLFQNRKKLGHKGDREGNLNQRVTWMRTKVNWIFPIPSLTAQVQVIYAVIYF